MSAPTPMQLFFDSFKTCARRQREFLEVDPFQFRKEPLRFHPANAVPEEQRDIGMQYIQYTKTCTIPGGSGKTQTSYFHYGLGAMAGWDAAVNDCTFKTQNRTNEMEVTYGQCFYTAKVVRWKEYLLPRTNGAEPEV